MVSDQTENLGMRIYCLSGLGADKRVFDYLTLNAELVSIDWLPPIAGESIEKYAMRLAEGINRKDAFGILGVSFGGLVAVEISKVLKPTITILISSAETRKELWSVFKMIGRLGLAKVLPASFFNPPKWLMVHLFEAENKRLLGEILDDSDVKFAKWATNELLTWKNQQRLVSVLKIGSVKDRLLPSDSDGDIRLIANGGHFMIVDRAFEVSNIINERLKGLEA